MVTYSEENYLKAIFHLEKSSPKGVNTTSLAGEMETKASSATDMIKRLSEKKLVNYKKYQGVKLSKSGKDTAIKIIRKHRLWEFFLVEKLGFPWDEVHEIAEQLEHIKSDKLISRLDEFLGHPKRDPHGDPIPDEKGNFTATDKVLLSKLKVGDSGVCIGVKDSSASFLQYLDKHKIALGKEIKVLEKEDFDHSLQIQIDGRKQSVSSLASNNLYLKTN